MKRLSGETRVKTRLRPNRVFAIVAALSLAAIGGIVEAPAAWAVDYPSWTDVQNAKASEAAKQAEVAKASGDDSNAWRICVSIGPAAGRLMSEVS